MAPNIANGVNQAGDRATPYELASDAGVRAGAGNGGASSGANGGAGRIMITLLS